MVRVGMVDKYDVGDRWFFHLDMDNPWPTICKERARYIRHRMTVRTLKRQPMIFLFFEVPDNKILCVKDQLHGEVKDGRKFFLNRSVVRSPGEFIHELMATHQQFVGLWEAWNEEEDAFFNEAMSIRKNLTLIQGGKV